MFRKKDENEALRVRGFKNETTFKGLSAQTIYDELCGVDTYGEFLDVLVERKVSFSLSIDSIDNVKTIKRLEDGLLFEFSRSYQGIPLWRGQKTLNDGDLVGKIYRGHHDKKVYCMKDGATRVASVRLLMPIKEDDFRVGIAQKGQLYYEGNDE